MAKFIVRARFTNPQNPNRYVDTYRDVIADSEYMAVQLAEGKMRTGTGYANWNFQLRSIEKRG